MPTSELVCWHAVVVSELSDGGTLRQYNCLLVKEKKIIMWVMKERKVQKTSDIIGDLLLTGVHVLGGPVQRGGLRPACREGQEALPEEEPAAGAAPTGQQQQEQDH